jgi:malonate-semialdehyde dehydrogenase (acetylating)/methylmalonate-semialdehyde dehydrogenase
MSADNLDAAIKLVNENPYGSHFHKLCCSPGVGNGTAIFTNSGSAARKYQHEIDCGQVCLCVTFV